MAKDFSKRVEALLDQRGLRPDSPGCAAGVYLNGEPLAEVCRGIRTLFGREPITATTNFRIASVSKQFTAAAILRLIEGGPLTLEATLCELFPDFPAYGAQITVGDLVGHTSGLRDYEPLVTPDHGEIIRDAEVLAIMMQQDGADFPPGSRYRYSNSGYALLAMIVERVAGCPFPEFMARHILGPAGMTRSQVWDSRGPAVEERALGHEPTADDGWTERDQSRTSSVLGDGGVYTSIREYALWDRALASGTILGPQSLRLAMTPGRLDDGTATGYGFGWRLQEKRGLLVAHHTGSTVGFRSFARRIPAIGLCTVVLSNRSREDAWELAPMIEDITLEELKDLLP